MNGHLDLWNSTSFYTHITFISIYSNAEYVLLLLDNPPHCSVTFASFPSLISWSSSRACQASRSRSADLRPVSEVCIWSCDLNSLILDQFSIHRSFDKYGPRYFDITGFSLPSRFWLWKSCVQILICLSNWLEFLNWVVFCQCYRLFS